MKKIFLLPASKLCLIIGIALLLRGTLASAQPANTPWPQFQQNQWNDGRQIQWAWPVSATVGLNELLGGQITGSPIIRSDGAIIVGSSNDTLYCVHPDSTPKILWKYSSGLGNQIFGAAAVSQNGYVYFGSRDNYFTILNANNGGFVKSWNVSSAVESPPVIAANGRMYFGDPVGNGYLNCIEGTDLKWSLALSTKIYTSGPAVRGDTIYAGGAAGLINALYAVTDNGASGAVKWFCRIWSSPGSIYSSPAVTNDTVYFTCNNGKFYMLRDTGTSYDTTSIQIGLPLGQTVFVYRSSPAIGPDGMVYVGVPWAVRGPGDTTGCLVAINPTAKGLAVKWRYWIGGFNAKMQVFSSPAIDKNGRIFFGGQDGTFYVLEDAGATANLRWNYATGGALRSSPAIGDDGTVYIGSYDGRLYGFGPANPTAVEMSSFTLAAIADGVQLNWRTESEKDCDFWLIERSVNKDGSFKVIGKVPGHLSTNEPHQYSYTDVGNLEAGVYYYQLAEVDVNDNKTYYGPLMVKFEIKNLPLSYHLEKAYPNPATSLVNIKYALKNTGRASLKVYNILGQELRALVNGVQPAGYYTLVWDGKDSRGQKAANGVYLYRLTATNSNNSGGSASGGNAGDYSATNKVTILR